MNRFRRYLSVTLLLTVIVCALPAQNSNNRWPFDDYYPKKYFFNDRKDFQQQETNAKIGEAVHYMRLADITPFLELKPGKGENIVRLHYFPLFAHPLFIQVVCQNGQAILTWQKGKAIRGYVEHTTHWLMSDTGHVDVTEEEYYGNTWEKGVLDSGSCMLTKSEWSQIVEILTDIRFLKLYPHADDCIGFETPFILEYADINKKKAYYTECPNNQKENRLTNLLVSLVDRQYVNMVIRYADDVSGIEPCFPGGEKECFRFIDSTIQYPPDALRDLAEYDASVTLLVEKDGSVFCDANTINPIHDPYGFDDELIRVAKTMPRWKPAIINGDTFRCYTTIHHRFVLPPDIRPKYGHPTLETQRDSIAWNTLENYHMLLLVHPEEAVATQRMGQAYYWEYLLEHRPVQPPTSWDSSFYENDWDSFFDRTAVVPYPADSALEYFYKALALDSGQNIIWEIYMPILQLEQYLDRAHNPIAELPFDTVAGKHFPASSFINWPENGRYDFSKDSYGDAWSSLFWTDIFSKRLTLLNEPVLYDMSLKEDETHYRFTCIPSFHSDITFHVVKKGDKCMLYWKRLTDKYDSDHWNIVSHRLEKGESRLSAAQYKQFQQYIDSIKIDEMPRYKKQMMCDGEQWLIERKNAEGFRVCTTNIPEQQVKELFIFLSTCSKRPSKFRYLKFF